MVYAALRKVTDGVRLYAGTVVFTAGCIPLAISNNVWVLAAAVATLTIGELMGVPVQQALVAELVPKDARTKYMALYNLNIRLGMLIASLCVTIGALIQPWGMAVLYGLFGLVILLAFHQVLARSSRAEKLGATP